MGAPDLDELEALAKAAQVKMVSYSLDLSDEEQLFIAAANPTTLLALIARVRAAEGAVATALLAFDEIAEQSRHLRQGGADVSDLPGIEDGLSAAVDIAVTTSAVLSALPTPPEPMT